MMPSVPESLIWYRSKSNSAALDRISEADKPPEELTLRECRDFHLAKLTDLKVQTDFWCMIHDIWTGVWDELLGPYEPARLANFNDDDVYSVREAWDEGYISNWHRRDAERWIYTGIGAWSGLEAGNEIRMWFAIHDESGPTTEFGTSKVPAGWQLDDDENWTTAEGACQFPETGEIDTSQLRTLARAAMVAVKLLKPK